MDINEQQLSALASCLQQTLSADVTIRQQAEAFLRSIESSANFLISLLKLVDSSSLEIQTRVAAVIFFKNCVKRNWRQIEGSPDVISELDRLTVKTYIVDLMLKSPTVVQKQLSEALTMIVDNDFPHRWENLLEELVRRMSTRDFSVINGVLQMAHSIFKRYRYQARTDTLFLEIKFVLSQFASPLLELFKATDHLIKENHNSRQNLEILMNSLRYSCKIFYSLSYQDIPEFFEDHLSEFSTFFLRYLTYENELLLTPSLDEAGTIEKVRSVICQIVHLYIDRYPDEFLMTPQFMQAVWMLLVRTGSEVKHDKLASTAIAVLTAVVKQVRHKELFQGLETLQSICEKIVIPNMMFRESDEELFEDNPIDYIRRDMEGSDIGTRRRATSDLVKGLCEHFQQEVSSLMMSYISEMLKAYETDPKRKWRSKDTAIYLVSALAVRASIASQGATVLNPQVDILDFFNKHINPELHRTLESEALILKADAVKFVHTFRHHLPREVLLAAFSSIINHLLMPNYVLQTYAAITVERLLFLKRDGQLLLGRAELKPLIGSLLNNLFALIQEDPSKAEKTAENEYIMKAIMRMVVACKEDMTPFVNQVMSRFTNLIYLVSRNPSNPRFNHYLFEAVSGLIRFVGQNDLTTIHAFEGFLFPPFQAILQNDVQEFMPYVFQILAQLLELKATSFTDISDPYMALLPSLLMPSLWQQTANVPALVRLLQAYIEKGGIPIHSPQTVQPILGIFQKLIASKTYDHEGFHLINSLIEYVPRTVLEPYLKQIFLLLLNRLQSSKTNKFLRGFIHFLSLFIALTDGGHGAISITTLLDSMQSRLFYVILDSVYIAEVIKVTSPLEKKACAIAMIKLLTACPIFLDDPYFAIWPKLLDTLIRLLELSGEEEAELAMFSGLTDDDLLNESQQGNLASDYDQGNDVSGIAGYHVMYANLAYSTRRPHDPLKVIEDTKLFLAKSLHELSRAHPGRFPAVISRLSEESMRFLNQYLDRAGIHGLS